MAKLWSVIFVALMPLLARAAEVDAPPPPPADVSAWGMIIFAVVFFGMVFGFLGFIWWKERARKQASSKA
ncbi:MAG TPA: hypothetical protein VJ834_06665 [Burkholderiales bacterium]|nr:hypothetical protein [Burkholderiales bacterium]